MATAGSPNKSAFLRELFGRKPDLNLEQANEAWQEAGNEGEVGSSLFYNVRRELKGGAGTEEEPARKPKGKATAKGPKGKRTDRPVDEGRPESDGETATKAAERTSASGERERVLDLVEDGI